MSGREAVIGDLTGDLIGDLTGTLTAGPHRAGRVMHTHTQSARDARTSPWPDWVEPVVRERFVAHGIERLWTHQVAAADLAWSGRSVAVATGTASGKSTAYLLPALSAARQKAARQEQPTTRSDRRPGGQSGRPGGGTTLYLAPTKALAADQLRVVDELAVPGIVAMPFDGDTPREMRDVARGHAQLLLSNPDMLHRSLLPRHERWASFLGRLRFIVVDESHVYRGVFGSHVAQVLRRFRRVCAAYGSSPVFVTASATSSDPATSAERLLGVPVTAVTDDGSPRGSRTFLLWEPPLLPGAGQTSGDRSADDGPRERHRNVLPETADLLTDLVAAGARTVTFVRSRRGAEVVAELARGSLAEIDAGLRDRVAAYRSGYLPQERRELEASLQDGRLLGVAATSALELGVDVSGLDAVLIAGWPGTRASLFQQAGRAGRSGSESVAVLVARDDPLDAYVVRHPEAVFGRPVEATVLDPDNPYVLGPHLCAAAAERPLVPDDLDLFGPAAEDIVARLERQGMLRRRSGPRWHWTRTERADALADLRGTGEPMVALMEAGTGRLLGTVDAARAHTTAHPGAVYVHQGETYVVDDLDLADGVATLHAAQPPYTTSAQEISTLRILETTETCSWGRVGLHRGVVEVSTQVVGYLERALGTGEVLGNRSLELPVRTLRTVAVWWTVPDDVVTGAGIDRATAPGAAHAAEHAAIGMLPLLANCDRWDVGGLSTIRHADTGVLTVFVHDGHPGGAGFAERGFRAAAAWLSATREAIASCPCSDGCPSCVYSPKCGNGNDPLDKAGAGQLLDSILADAEGVSTSDSCDGGAPSTSM